MNKTTQKVIDTLQAVMEEGALIWHNPCLMVQQSNAASGKPYQGINQFLTAMVASIEGYSSPYWATFNQIKELGGTLEDARGKGVPILFYKALPSKENAEADQPRYVARHSCVFNLDLITGIALDQVDCTGEGQAVLDADAEAIAAAYTDRETIRVSHGSPAYTVSIDTVYMPHPSEVTTTDEYYSCLFHELAHSTGHPSRLARFSSDSARFESKEDYSKEELVAEITAALLCHECGVDGEASIKNSAAYIQGWSRFIRNEENAFLCAINQAYKARAFILAGEGGHSG